MFLGMITQNIIHCLFSQLILKNSSIETISLLMFICINIWSYFQIQLSIYIQCQISVLDINCFLNIITSPHSKQQFYPLKNLLHPYSELLKELFYPIYILKAIPIPFFLLKNLIPMQAHLKLSLENLQLMQYLTTIFVFNHQIAFLLSHLPYFIN